MFVFGQKFTDTVSKMDFKSKVPQVFLSDSGKAENQSSILDFSFESPVFDRQIFFLLHSLGRAGPKETQVMMNTSGATGLSKQAVLSHRKTFFHCLSVEPTFT